jgi:hypothetical protein
VNTRASPPRVHSGTGSPGGGANGPHPPRLSDEPAEHQLAGDPAAGAVPSAGDELAVGAVTTEITVVKAGAVRLADPPSFLAGRQELLAQLDARLADGERPGPRTVAPARAARAGRLLLARGLGRQYRE